MVAPGCKVESLSVRVHEAMIAADAVMASFAAECERARRIIRGEKPLAYLRTVTITCQQCSRSANVELINQRNASCGYYCKRCGERALAKLQEAEDKK